MTNAYAIETIELTKRYRDVVAIDDLNLTIEQGEVFGFLGPNGSGKTTTVKLILGLVTPTSGEIRVFGQPLAGRRKELLRQIGAMVEAPAFYPYLSGHENLVVLAKMTGIAEQDVRAALARVGLADAAGRRFETYSLGMKQRLAIAAALLRRPRLVLLDEPTSGLDPEGQREIQDLIPDLARDGCTVFISSHMMREVEVICDRVGIIQHGRLKYTARVDDLVRGQSAIEVRVDVPAAARDILERIDWVTSVSLDGGLLIISAPPGRAVDINRALATEGIFASEIRQRERSVEEVFFETIADRAA